jgi:biopolymer transport protein ExbB
MLQDSNSQPVDPASATTEVDPNAAAIAAPPAAVTEAQPSAVPSAIPTGITDTDAEAFQQMGFDHLLVGFDMVGWVVFVTLVVMSIGSWYYTVVNVLSNLRVSSRADRVVRTFWETTNAQDAIHFMQEQPKTEPFSKIALDCAEAAAHHQRSEGSRLAEALNRSEFIDRALRQAVTRENSRLESGMTWLATVGATAPFVGLLGTVWGIYHALIKIGQTGQASIDAVAGPVGEALIMTALGLFVAIPAVLAYNAFVRVNRVTNSKFDTFAHDLHDFFATGSRVGESAAKR